VCAVEVRRPGHHQPQPAGQRPHLSPFRRRVVLVVGLQPEQARSDQLLDQRVRHDPSALGGPRMREDRHPAGPPHRPHGFEHIKIVLGYEVPAAQPSRGERLVRRPHQPGPDQRLGDVRPPDRTARRIVLHLGPRDVHTVRPEPADDPLGALLPVFAQPGQIRRQPRFRGVEQVRQQVQGDRPLRPVPPATELRTPHQPQAVRPGPRRLGPSARGVVIGDRHHVQSGGPARGDQFGRCQRSVAGGGVAVQVDSGHPTTLAGRPAQTSRV
jgi:hypothetical protein